MPLIRILSWNILQGGGRRTDAILAAVERHQPDIFAIQEHRGNSKSVYFKEQLHHLGLTSFFRPKTESPSQNNPAIAARWPFQTKLFPLEEASQTRCLHAIFEAPDAPVTLELCNVHLPHKKEQIPVFNYLLDLPPNLRQSNSLLIGDFNCGIPFEDSETKSFENSSKFQQLKTLGWIDAWRERNLEAREFTWISSKKKNGYRYDNALVSPALNPLIKKVEYDHSVREESCSDHSAMFLDIQLPDEGCF